MTTGIAAPGLQALHDRLGRESLGQDAGANLPVLDAEEAVDVEGGAGPFPGKILPADDRRHPDLAIRGMPGSWPQNGPGLDADPSAVR